MNSHTLIAGVVRNGKVELQNDALLPEGARVNIVMVSADVTPELPQVPQRWVKLGFLKVFGGVVLS